MLSLPPIGPSTTKGATILLWRRPATKVVVFQCPCGTWSINRMPRGQRPRSRTMLVEVAVSSMNTSRAGSNMPCSRIQRRRAGHVRSLLLRRAQAFLKLIPWRANNRQTALRLPAMRRARIAATISSSVRSDCSATKDLPLAHACCSQWGSALRRQSFDDDRHHHAQDPNRDRGDEQRGHVTRVSRPISFDSLRLQSPIMCPD